MCQILVYLISTSEKDLPVFDNCMGIYRVNFCPRIKHWPLVHGNGAFAMAYCGDSWWLQSSEVRGECKGWAHSGKGTK